MSSELRLIARRYAVAMCAHVAAEREAETAQVLGMFIAEAAELGYLPCEAWIALAQTSVGLAVSAAGEDGEAFFTGLAVDLAVKS